jgi:hypothetical protein
MKLDLICNVCSDEIKADADMIGQKCKKCEDGSYIDKSSASAEGSTPPEEKGTEQGGDNNITKEAAKELIEMVQEENAYDFNKKFKSLLNDSIKEAINERKKEILESYSDKKIINEEIEIGSIGVLDDGSEFSVVSISGDIVTILVGGKEMEMSKEEFEERAKLNTDV